MKNSASTGPASCGQGAFYLHPVMTKKIGKRALLCATALVSVAGAGWADEVIDGGAVEIVDGAGTVAGGTKDSPWTITELLDVGYTGVGELIVRNGGSVSNRKGYIGTFFGSDGKVTVTGEGSSWANSGGLFVGNMGMGTLTVAAGGSVSNTDGYIGRDAGSEGKVTVTGAGSSWETSETLFVGMDGTGALTIADGATVTVGGGVNLATQLSAAGTLNIGPAAGDNAAAAGTLAAANVGFGAGAGEIVFNHTDTGYAFDPTISGNRSVSVLAGTTVLNGTHSYSGG
ncbi:hypothetical protein ACJ5NV_10505 [Loktanella agnita]|uniref:hypothetical protein n=1 Tax=Loktanella agnita TaxID=287097 RepID=UPI0039858F1C